jgi:peptidoglycan/xylan/chitin deacetylase (PgdA/CDA1 family)
MVNFKTITVLFFLIITGVNLYLLLSHGFVHGIVQEYRWLVYSGIVFTYLSVSFLFAFLPCSGFHHKGVICRFPTPEKSVCLTFDDGPHPIQTPAILDVLRRYNIQALFFCIGKNVAENEQLVSRMAAEGHMIGNHSFGHSPWFDWYSSGKIFNELMRTDQAIQKATGVPVRFFRPPFGVINPMVSKALKRGSWSAICWNVRSFDTVINKPVKVHRRILKRVSAGSILLLHDHTSYSVNHLEELIIKLTDQGFSFTLPKLNDHYDV